jgi:hypothetical protein
MNDTSVIRGIQSALQRTGERGKSAKDAYLLHSAQLELPFLTFPPSPLIVKPDEEDEGIFGGILGGRSGGKCQCLMQSRTNASGTWIAHPWNLEILARLVNSLSSTRLLWRS